MTRTGYITRPDFSVPPSSPSPKTPGRRLIVPALLPALFVVLLSLPSSPLAQTRPGGRSIVLNAPIYLLVEVSSGRVIVEKSVDQPHPPASIVKIMTMLLVMDAIDQGEIALEDVAVISARASRIGGSQAYLAEDEEMTVRDLLKAVAIKSANDASTALAEHVSGEVEDFVDRMNDRAIELGMKSTVFQTPHGLPPGPGQEADVTSARDVMIMSRELILKYPKILEYTGLKQDSLRGGKFRLDNTNKLVGRMTGVDGLKTGYTRDAGFGLVATASRSGLRFISVVMGAKSGKQRTRDSTRLLSHGFSSFRNYLAAKAGQEMAQIKVPLGMTEEVVAEMGEDFRVLIRRADIRQLKFKVSPLAELTAPIEAGEKIGTYVALLDGEIVGEAPLVARQSVEKANLVIRFFRWLLALLNIH